MEKFRKFADPGTGKQPFLEAPPNPLYKISIAEIITGFPKMIVFILFWILYVVFSMIRFPIFPRLFAKIMLILLGVDLQIEGIIYIILSVNI